MICHVAGQEPKLFLFGVKVSCGVILIAVVRWMSTDLQCYVFGLESYVFSHEK